MSPLLRIVGYVLLAMGVALVALQAAQLAHEGVLPHGALVVPTKSAQVV